MFEPHTDPAAPAAPPSARAAELRFIDLHRSDAGATRAELAAGLLARPPHIAPKYFYDVLGSRLFDAITALPEYTPTRCEAAIFERHGPEIAAALGTDSTLVDLGAGNCAKAARLFPLLKPRTYIAVDISAEYLRHALSGLQREHPHIAMLGLGMDFTAGFELPLVAGPGRRTIFYPGSSIGNFTPDEALPLLRQMRREAAGGGLLIGVDLVKPLPVLQVAYDDPLGITAAFNLNVLRHVNGLLEADFEVSQWQHVALFNALESRIEMHLEALEDCRVRWPGGERRFEAGERLHTESSYKYRTADFESLLRDAGFTELHTWTDEPGWFAVVVAR